MSLFATYIPLSWSPSPDTNVAGYHVWWGYQSGRYVNMQDAGLQTSFRVDEIASGATVYINVTGYNQFHQDSDFANEVSFTPPAPVTLPPPPNPVTFGPDGSLVIFTQNSVSLTPGGSVTVGPGAHVNFSATANGPGPITYQWFFGTTVITGAQTNSLALTNVTAADAGTYVLAASNPGGTVASGAMTLAVLPPAAGPYNGLFYETNAEGSPHIRSATSGLLANCVVGDGGIYSGRIYVNNYGYAVAGAIDPYGNSETLVPRPDTGLATLDIRLHLEATETNGQLTGTVSNMDTNAPWTASLLADSAATNITLPPLMQANLLTDDTNLASAGQLYMVNALSHLSMLGQLSDGTVFFENTPVSVTGRLPIYSALNNGLGVIIGWMNASNGSPNGVLTWIRQTPPGWVLASGFTNRLLAVPAGP